MAETSISVLVPAFGGPEVLELGRRSVPAPGPGQLRIAVTSATVNNTDLLLRSGAQRRFLEHLPPPYTPGMEFAGRVEGTGGVRGEWQAGDRVAGIVSAWRPEGGAQAGAIVVDEASVMATPAELTDDEAATLPMNGLTALLALDALGLPAGATLAVTGAVGAVGGYVIQLAKSRDLVVVADADPSDEADVAELGADVIVPRGDRYVSAVLDACPRGVDGLVDTALLGERVASLVSDGGAVVTLRGFVAETDRGVRFVPIFVPDHVRDGDRLELVRVAAARGALTPRLAEVLPASEVRTAHRRLARGGERGRLVLSFTT